MKVLMVAEKPSIALAIAKILSKGRFQTSKGVATPIHEFQGNFRGQDCQFVVTSVMGHVYALDFQSSNDWNEDPRHLFTAKTVKKESNPKQNVCFHLKKVSKGCHSLVLWLDCDREGENIGFEVIENCIGNLACKSVYRARFSSVTNVDVHRAINNLVKPNENEAKAVDARQEIDLKVGVAFTRYQTMRFHQKYSDLNSELISYGPCQTPTLCFCVDRHDEIKVFRSSTYYKLQVFVDLQGKRTKLKWNPNQPIKDLGEIKNIQKKISTHKEAVCVDVKCSTKKMQRPNGLNTVQMLKVASSNLGINAWQCMSIAEKLYTQGYISYPRTESTSYPSGFDFKGVLGEFCKTTGEWKHLVVDLMKDWKQPRGGVDVGDHPPIVPTKWVDSFNLNPSEWKLYEYVANHFFGTISGDSVLEVQSATYAIGSENFAIKGVTVKEMGFLKFMQWLKPSETLLPHIDVGSRSSVLDVGIKEGHTKPPNYLTESELIGLMEKNRIGTDASIPTHIENIIKRNYVTLDQKKHSLIPTKLGITLIHGYKAVDPELALPMIRAKIESLINEIATGKVEYSTVVKNSLELFQSKYDRFTSNIDKVDLLFSGNFLQYSNLQDVDFSIKPQCGVCRRYMKFIKTRPRRLYCVECDRSYKVPRMGDIKEGGGNLICPLDGFQVVYMVDENKTANPFCPKCYSDGQEDLMCLKCPNLACQINPSNFVVTNECVNCDFGKLTLDQLNSNKIMCVYCRFTIKLPKNTARCILLNRTCKQCNTYKMVHLKFGANNTPKPGEPEFDTCIKCDPLISSKCSKVFPSQKKPSIATHTRVPFPSGGEFSKKMTVHSASSLSRTESSNEKAHIKAPPLSSARSFADEKTRTRTPSFSHSSSTTENIASKRTHSNDSPSSNPNVKSHTRAQPSSGIANKKNYTRAPPHSTKDPSDTKTRKKVSFAPPEHANSGNKNPRTTAPPPDVKTSQHHSRNKSKPNYRIKT